MTTKKWSEVRHKASEEKRAEVKARVAETVAAMPLYRLREARRLTQKQVAESLQIDQGRVSKLERKTDFYVSTLRNFVGAMGGQLELVARFPDGSVLITSLGADEVQGPS